MLPNDQASNRLRLLKRLRRAEPVSRTELTALTGLASATVTALTADLVRRGLILERKVHLPGRGRPRVALSLDASAAYAAGAFVDINGTLVTQIVDLRGAPVFFRTALIRPTDSLEEFADEIGRLAEEAVAASGLRRSQIRRAGIALPGLIDSVTGVLHWMHTFPPGPVPFAALVERRLGIPVVLDNSSNIIARGEHWFGNEPGGEHFVLIDVGLGIGSARYAGGSLWLGAHGLNPEISHTKVVPEGGRQCFCGASGCVSAYASLASIMAQIRELRGLPSHDFPAVLAACLEVLANDAEARRVFERAGMLLGVAVANYVNATDPQLVIMNYHHRCFTDLMAASFRSSIEDNMLPPLRHQTKLEFVEASTDQFRRGVAALVLEQIYGAAS